MNGVRLYPTFAREVMPGKRSIGAMLTNATTPDGYDVGAGGKWISMASQKIMPLYEGQAEPFQKINGHYVYSGDIMGYDESRIKAEDDWTAGFYAAVNGTFYIDSNTRGTVKDSDFPVKGKTADQWLDDYFARKKYWMILYIKVRGDHIEEIAAIDSIC